MRKDKFYALICFHILTGKKDISPTYLAEKIEILNDGRNAFNWLDYKNMGEVINYCETWHILVPVEWNVRYALEMDALKKLQQVGYDF